MDLAKIVRGAVKTADSVTKSLQGLVFFSAWTGQNGYGDSTYAAVQSLPAIIEQKMAEVRTASGQLVTTRASVMFLAVVEPNGAVGRTEPIDARDKIILPDGTTGPIVAVEGMTDPGTSRNYFNTVYLG